MAKNFHSPVGRNKLTKLAQYACAAARKVGCDDLREVKVREAIEADMAMNGFVVNKEQIKDMVIDVFAGTLERSSTPGVVFSSLWHVLTESSMKRVKKVR